MVAIDTIVTVYALPASLPKNNDIDNVISGSEYREIQHDLTIEGNKMN